MHKLHGRWTDVQQGTNRYHVLIPLPPFLCALPPPPPRTPIIIDCDH
jgi:hypothetical protein